MATMISTSFSTPAVRREGRAEVSGFKAFWRAFFAKAFDPYRPELHYMRGPGPAWRAAVGAYLNRRSLRAQRMRATMATPR